MALGLTQPLTEMSTSVKCVKSQSYSVLNPKVIVCQIPKLWCVKSQSYGMLNPKIMVR